MDKDTKLAIIEAVCDPPRGHRFTGGSGCVVDVENQSPDRAYEDARKGFSFAPRSSEACRTSPCVARLSD
jgi:hypothetical protein